VGKRARLLKITDYETHFWCARGFGILREEVWINDKREIVRYNLAFLLPYLSSVDNGRILGFDNAHGIHERHFLGEVEPVKFKGYAATAERFYREAEVLRRSYENKDI